MLPKNKNKVKRCDPRAGKANPIEPIPPPTRPSTDIQDLLIEHALSAWCFSQSTICFGGKDGKSYLKQAATRSDAQLQTWDDMGPVLAVLLTNTRESFRLS